MTLKAQAGDASLGVHFEQPASLLIVAGFALNNVRMFLLSGTGMPHDPATGRGTVGMNYAYLTMSSAASFFDEDVIINPFMPSGASGTLINDFAGWITSNQAGAPVLVASQ